MTKKEIRVEIDNDISPRYNKTSLDEYIKSLIKLREQDHSGYLRLEVESDHDQAYPGSEYGCSWGTRLYGIRIETDKEYKDRLESESIRLKREEERERRQLEYLQNKYAKENTPR